MDAGIKQMLLKAKLNERNIIYLFRKEHGLNSFDLDILLFANQNQLLNVYEVRKYFQHTNIQQIRRSVNKLSRTSCLEVLRFGTKGKPTLYLLTKKGEVTIGLYEKLIMDVIDNPVPTSQ